MSENILVKLFEQGMLYLHLIAADSADDMMMVIPGNFIHEMTITGLGGARKAVLCKELECAVNGWFCKARQFLFRLPVHFARGKMRPGMTQSMQDRHPLRRHSEAAGAKLGGIFRSAGHRDSYCKFLQ